MTLGAMAQNKQLLYGFDKVPQSLLLNPGARVSQKAHFGIPFLSQIHVNAGSTGVTVFDIFKEDESSINDRIREQIFSLNNKDFFTANQQLEILNFGWKNKNGTYFSGGIYQELDFMLYFPKDLAVLAWEGNRNYINNPFDFSDLTFTGEVITAFHFGLNKEVNKNLTVGIRGKIYSSIIDFRSTNNSGTFLTREGEGLDNFYEHSINNADVSIQTSGYSSLREMDGSDEVVKELLGRTLLGGNLGVGVDIGATYRPNELWEYSASMLDLGAIFYTKDVENYSAKGSYALQGIELIFPPIVNGEPGIPYYDTIGDDLKEAIPIDTLSNSYTRLRPLKMNASIKRNFGRRVGSESCDCLKMGGLQDYNQAVGVQLYNIFRPKGPQLAGTLFYQRRLGRYLSAKATYTADPFSYTNIGFGIAADIWKINFYLAADNLLSYSNLAKSNGVSLQFGLNIKIKEEE